MSASNATSKLKQNGSRAQIRILLWIGFGGVLLLMVIVAISAISFLNQIELRQAEIRQDYVKRNIILEHLRSTTYRSGTYLRDFLIDSDGSRAAENGRRYQQARNEIRTEMAEYRRLLRNDEETPFRELSDELDSYIKALDGALTWDSRTRQAQGVAFVRVELLPRRMTVIGLANRIQDIGQKDLEAGSQAVSQLFSSFRFKLTLLVGGTILLALLLSNVTMCRLLQLERESAARFKLAVEAQGELKRLSAELVAAQESERRRIARELHDEIGQVLSAIVFALGNLRSALNHRDLEEVRVQADAVQEMVTQNVNVVRSMSLLLRPTMLDDLGLLPALNWLARETSRSSPVRVDLSAEPITSALPDEHRTCVYRVVQESVRNAVRHAGAQHIRIYVQLREDKLFVSVQDDGKGFQPRKQKGLGLLGMEERVTNLGGALRIESELGRGTIIAFHLPFPEIAAEIERAEPTNESVPFSHSTE